MTSSQVILNWPQTNDDPGDIQSGGVFSSFLPLLRKLREIAARQVDNLSLSNEAQTIWLSCCHNYALLSPASPQHQCNIWKETSKQLAMFLSYTIVVLLWWWCGLSISFCAWSNRLLIIEVRHTPSVFGLLFVYWVDGVMESLEEDSLKGSMWCSIPVHSHQCIRQMIIYH